MRKLYNPIFPCNINLKNDELPISCLDFEKDIEIVPFNHGFGLFNQNWYWINEEEKEKIRNISKRIVEFSPLTDLARGKSDGWYSLNPIELEIELTSICNQKCIHCGNASTSTGHSLNLEKIIETIKEFKVGGGQRLLLTGGEPLMYPHLKEILEFCKDVNIKKMEMVSNGSLIDKPKAKFISQYFKYICISIHGHKPEIHDKIVQLEGGFERATKGIKYLNEEGVDVLLYFTIMNENFESIPYIFDLSKKLECKGVRFNCINPVGRAKDKKTISVEGKKLLIDFILKLSTEKNVNVISSELYRKDYFDEINTYKFFGCNALRTLIYFNSEGFAYPCSMIPDFVIGNIYQSSLPKIWESELANNFRKTECRNCNSLNDCGGLCKAKSFRKLTN